MSIIDKVKNCSYPKFNHVLVSALIFIQGSPRLLTVGL